MLDQELKQQWDVLEGVRTALSAGIPSLEDLPNLLRQSDPLVTAIMTALERAALCGAPELYAESAAHFLVQRTHTCSRTRSTFPSTKRRPRTSWAPSRTFSGWRE